jgi:hypothetical protein
LYLDPYFFSVNTSPIVKLSRSLLDNPAISISV